MPVLVLPMPETHESIARPVCFQVIKDLLKMTGINNLSSIYFPGDERQAYMPGSAIDNVFEDIKFGKGERFHVEVSEEYVEQHALAVAVTRPDNIEVFTDRALGVSIKPAYSPTEVTLTIVYRAQDRSSAERWRNEMKTRFSMRRDVLLHEVDYHYAIPSEYLVILHHLHTLKEAQAGYGEEYRGWLDRCLSKQASVRTTQAGTQPVLTINERQVWVQGHFDFTGAPEEVSKEGEGANYSISLSYRFIYDKPTSCVMEYPLIVHNQVVDARFRDRNTPYGTGDQGNRPAFSRYNYDAVSGIYQRKSPLAGYSIPGWDTWLPAHVPPFTTTMLKIMLALKEEQPDTLLNFHQLGRLYKLQPELLEFLKDEARWLTTPGESVFHVTLFRDVLPMEGDLIEVDAELNLRTKAPLDLRRQYRARLAVVNDLLTLSGQALTRLAERPKICHTVIEALARTYELETGNNAGARKITLPKVLAGRYVSSGDLKRAAHELKSLTRPYRTGIEYNHLLVGQFIIAAGTNP